MSNYLEPFKDMQDAFKEVHKDVKASACKINITPPTDTNSYLRICVGGSPDAKDMVFRKMSADHTAGFGHDQRDMEYYSQWSDTGEFGELDTIAMYEMNLNLVGVINSQFVCLGFTTLQSLAEWKKSTEYDYLRYIKPWLKGKVICICASSESIENKILTDMLINGWITTTYSNLVRMMNEGGYQKYFMSEAYELSRCLQEILFSEFGIQPNLEEAPPFVDEMTPIPYVGEDRLESLLVGQTEITQGLYQYVMGNNPSFFKRSDDLPVEQVSWFDLLEFCNKLSEMQGFRPCYYAIVADEHGSAKWDRSANGYRLLSEDEWEYIANANRDFKYSGSDSVDEVAWWNDNSGRKTRDVGTKKENSFGTYDQSGNVFEWCWDLPFEFIRKSRVIRGASWSVNASGTRVGHSRSSAHATFQGYGVGGRLSRSPDPTEPRQRLR